MTREEAKEALSVLKIYDNQWLREAIDMAIEALRFDRPQGEWIDVNGDGSLWRCSRCKDTACCNGNYCPTCGAKMKWSYGE